MVSGLDLKLFRDLSVLKAQVFTIALVVACGIGTLVGMTSTYDSLNLAKRTFYERSRFADVFASLSRAPSTEVASILSIPGVQRDRKSVV